MWLRKARGTPAEWKRRAAEQQRVIERTVAQLRAAGLDDACAGEANVAGADKGDQSFQFRPQHVLPRCPRLFLDSSIDKTCVFLYENFYHIPFTVFYVEGVLMSIFRTSSLELTSLKKSASGWRVLAVLAPLVASSPLSATETGIDSATETGIDATVPANPKSASIINEVLPAGEGDKQAPVDYGPGPGKGRPMEVATAPLARVTIPTCGPNAHQTGCFGPVITWPIIPIHVALLQDGRVLSYGTNQRGQQGAKLVYDVWDQKLNSHSVLSNTTGTDIFCSSQSVMENGEVLITGGDQTINGVRNFSNNKTTLFNPLTNSLSSGPRNMNFPRWYPALVSLSNGKKAVFGGINTAIVNGVKSGIPSRTPELTTPNEGWQTLNGATSNAAFGANSNWFYPRAFAIPGGNVGVLTNDGLIFAVNTSGAGSITQIGNTTLPGSPVYPAAQYAPGQWIALRNNKNVITIKFNPGLATVKPTDPMNQDRKWGHFTVMPNGNVFVDGGSSANNQLTGVAYHSAIWNPVTGHFTPGATAQKPRLYHSTDLTLPDGTILTGGGGAPGPVINLNAEIFYPGYLYAQNGAPAARPTLAGMPTAVSLGAVVRGTVGPNDQITQVTALRTGSATHSYNTDQGFLQLPFTQTGQRLTVRLPQDPTIMIPGNFMIYAWNRNGVPSIAPIINVR